MKIVCGKYMFVENINAIFGPRIRYADTIERLKLKRYEKDVITNGKALLCQAHEGKIIRCDSNGRSIV